MGRINLEALRKIEKERNRKYVWHKPLAICGKTFPQTTRFTLPHVTHEDYTKGGDINVSKTV